MRSDYREMHCIDNVWFRSVTLSLRTYICLFLAKRQSLRNDHNLCAKQSTLWEDLIIERCIVLIIIHSAPSCKCLFRPCYLEGRTRLWRSGRSGTRPPPARSRRPHDAATHISVCMHVMSAIVAERCENYKLFERSLVITTDHHQRFTIVPWCTFTITDWPPSRFNYSFCIQVCKNMLAMYLSKAITSK